MGYDDTYAWDNKDMDRVAAKELYLFITSDGDLYRQQYEPILRNLTTKKAQGVYKSDLAAKLFGYLVESGAKKYIGTDRGSRWHEVFPKALRDTVAEELRDDFEAEYSTGAYDMYVPAKYKKPKQAKPRKTSKSSPSGFGGMR